MNKQSKKLNSKTDSETQSFGRKIGASLRGGEVIELIGDLGAGKTTLTKAIVQGAGSHDHVSSPTFVVNKVYRARDFDINHYDFYRLNDPGLLSNELEEVIDDDSSVAIIEWGGSVNSLLPDSRIIIYIKPKSENEREIELLIPESRKYILENL
jgi:tRNA threonylcarbamoyladenosine biosynthesis protein TsaE